MNEISNFSFLKVSWIQGQPGLLKKDGRLGMELGTHEMIPGYSSMPLSSHYNPIYTLMLSN